MDEWIPVIVVVVAPLVLNFVALLFPKGHHWRFMDRWLVKDEEKADADDET